MAGLIRRKKRPEIPYVEPELNIMPFIDIFSMLTTFLLVSAAFVMFGMIEVELPFITSEPPDDDPERQFEVRLNLSRDEIEIMTYYTQPPREEASETFRANEMERLHTFMYELRRENPDTDKVHMYTEPDVTYREIALTLETIKLLNQERETPILKPDATDRDKMLARVFIWPKVVMADVRDGRDARLEQ